MTASALVVLLALAGKGDAVRMADQQYERLKFKAPAEWKKAPAEDGSGAEWANEDMRVSMSVFPVDPIRPAKACLDQIVEALKWESPMVMSVGLAPAAKRVEHDVVKEAKEGGEPEEKKVTTTTFVGCDGRTKWVLTIVGPTAQAVKLGQVVKRVSESIKYGKK